MFWENTKMENKNVNVKAGTASLSIQVLSPTTKIERTLEYYKQNKKVFVLAVLTIIIISYGGKFLSGWISFLYSFFIGTIMLILFPSWREKIIKTEIEQTKRI